MSCVDRPMSIEDIFIEIGSRVVVNKEYWIEVDTSDYSIIFVKNSRGTILDKTVRRIEDFYKSWTFELVHIHKVDFDAHSVYFSSYSVSREDATKEVITCLQEILRKIEEEEGM